MPTCLGYPLTDLRHAYVLPIIVSYLAIICCAIFYAQLHKWKRGYNTTPSSILLIMLIHCQMTKYYKAKAAPTLNNTALCPRQDNSIAQSKVLRSSRKL